MSHIHKEIDFTVEVFIVYKNKVLLRMHDKHNIWLSVGGHIELDEDPVQAAIREAKEEVELDINIVNVKSIDEEPDYKPLATPRYLGSHQVSNTHKHIIFIYFAKSNTDIISNSKMKHERAKTCWITKEELVSMNLRPNILFYATEALKELGKK